MEAKNQCLPDSLAPWHCAQSSRARPTTFIGARLYRSNTPRHLYVRQRLAALIGKEVINEEPSFQSLGSDGFA